MLQAASNTVLNVRPIAGALGAEVHDIDLGESLDERTFVAIKQALHEYGVIFFRDQDITPAQQYAFARHWGSIHVHPHLPSLDGYPGLLPVIKDKHDKVNLGGDWHTDQMFTPTPARMTMLYAKQVPAAGGDTLFADLYSAYESLSAGMKAMIANLRTVNVYNKSKPRASAMRVSAPNQMAEEAIHPLVRPHPETGREALYICYRNITRRIEGMSEQESAPLLDYLLEHATRPEFTCRFRWYEGSLALWDNPRTLHLAINDYHGQQRIMHRITIQGESTI